MDRKFNRNLQLGYGFSILMLLFVGLISYRTVNSLLSSNRAVAHSTLVIQKLEKALSLMKDAETGQRGYLLTGRKQFLEPYIGTQEQSLRLIEEAIGLTRDNPAQHNNVLFIKGIMVDRFVMLQLLIDKRERGEAITPQELDAGKDAMDDLRRATDRAENDEQRLLYQRKSRFDQFTFLTPIVIIGAILLAVIIALTSYVRVIRDITEKERLRAELELKEQETAAMNEELSAANEEITAANEEITAANEELTSINEELIEAREELATINESLEEKVAQRTKALADSEEETQALNEELISSNEELASTNEELASTNEELLATNEELFGAKQSLERSERLFSSIARNIPGSLLMVLSPDERLIAVEGDQAQSLGYSSADIGRPIAEVVPDRYEEAGPLYKRMLAGEQFRNERTGRDGGDYQVDFVPLRNEKEEIYAGLVIVLDITERKKAEERSAKLAAIVESSDDAIIGKTLDGTITSWNKGAQRMFGYTEDEIIGQSILKLIPDDRQDEENMIITQINNGGAVDHLETRRLTKEGRQLDVAITASPIRDPSGKIIGVSKISRDISEQKQDEQRKNDFIGMASHELKTPLTSLSALIQVLNMKLKDNPDSFIPSALSKANIQVRKMTGMINGFLNVSRLESGKIQIEKSHFDLTLLIREMINETELTVTSHTFVFDTAAPLPIDADRDKVGSVISNLISNAVKYSPRGKMITIRCEMKDNNALVSVADEGIGIKPQDLDKLFERYYRVTGTDTQHISGFGIGLYVSAEIIHRHGGKIWAESESGQGATFYFTLPLS